MNETTMDFATKTQFVDALLACPAIQDRQTRDAIVNTLKNVQGISRSDIDRTDVANIVDRVLDFQGGLAQLCEVLHFYEGDSVHMKQVSALYTQYGKPGGSPSIPDNTKSIHTDSKILSYRLIWALISLLLLVSILGIGWLVREFSSLANPQPTTLTLTPLTPTPALGVGSIYINPVDAATYVYVPAGEFIMGSDDGLNDESPQHTVYLDSYWIMETEVTNTQYRKFIEDRGYTEKIYWSTEGWTWRRNNDITEPRYWDDEHFNSGIQPIVSISWHEAEAYANWLSAKSGLDFGLPTEAQWEKAARGVDGRRFPWGNQWDGYRVNYCDSSCTNDWADQEVNDNYQYTAPVGDYPTGTSPYKALDMAGNVWEWTADWYEAGYYQNSPNRNLTGPTHGIYRALRGGSWNNGSVDLHVFGRYSLLPEDRSSIVGFRLVYHDTPREN